MSNLSIKGIVTHIMPVQSGESKSGKAYQKQEFAIQTQEQYPKTVAFLCFGDKVNLISSLVEGQEVEVHFNLESRQYQDKFFHNINAWKIDILTASAPSTGLTSAASAPSGADLQPNEGDLPF